MGPSFGGTLPHLPHASQLKADFIPSAFLVVLADELCIFMAGWMPQPTLHVSAMGVMMQVSGLAYMLPMVSPPLLAMPLQSQGEQ
jgi:hypothetical protein